MPKRNYLLTFSLPCFLFWHACSYNKHFPNSLQSPHWLQVEVVNDIVMHFLLYLISNHDFKALFVPIEANSRSTYCRLFLQRIQSISFHPVVYCMTRVYYFFGIRQCLYIWSFWNDSLRCVESPANDLSGNQPDKKRVYDVNGWIVVFCFFSIKLN